MTAIRRLLPRLSLSFVVMVELAGIAALIQTGVDGWARVILALAAANMPWQLSLLWRQGLQHW